MKGERKVDELVDRILGTRVVKKVKKSKKTAKNPIKVMHDAASNESDQGVLLCQEEKNEIEVQVMHSVQEEEEQDNQEARKESLTQMQILDQVLRQEGNSKVEDIKNKTETKNLKKIGKYLGIDCEMVGTGQDGANSVLARVSIVNYHGNTVLDEYVKAKEKITDYRSWVSGVYPHHLKDASDFETVQKKISDLLKDRILVGHALKNDLKVLMLNHPQHMIRDTSKYAPFRKYAKGKHPALKTLAKELLGLDIQGGKHCSVEDAKVAMLIFKKVKNEWETKFKNK